MTRRQIPDVQQVDAGCPHPAPRWDFQQMTLESAHLIADSWHYEPPYDFYDITADPEDYQEFIDPAQWPEVFNQVLLNGELAGFYSAQPDSRGGYEIAIGLRPDLTGKRLGPAFFANALADLRARVGNSNISLTVASFNARAIKVYESLGFTRIHSFDQATNGSIYPFVEMVQMG